MCMGAPAHGLSGRAAARKPMPGGQDSGPTSGTSAAGWSNFVASSFPVEQDLRFFRKQDPIVNQRALSAAPRDRRPLFECFEQALACHAQGRLPQAEDLYARV